MPCSKCFANMNSFNLHKNSMRLVLCRGESGDLERLGNLPRITQHWSFEHRRHGYRVCILRWSLWTGKHNGWAEQGPERSRISIYVSLLFPWTLFTKYFGFWHITRIRLLDLLNYVFLDTVFISPPAFAKTKANITNAALISSAHSPSSFLPWSLSTF